ncbi:class I SAM-dependent methyltransferase [Pseudonocardia endophytica]|uniref:S-adenosyl-L-methionine-dependent methyltransferase n=1 Tax=Pseudonocardia endophytica TaxID=401976 RepID=A0A4R1HX79_PSEEN|nr:SAM-dependent methyltransferase [Pseudonocardia endophytica]TCK26103.1 methyltransferase (TIGR00027 family) [Pseudonocardia endophytica]
MSTDLDPVATTSRITAAIRAAESARPDRLFDDPLAGTLAGDVGRAIAARIDSGDVIPVRTRFDDDGLRTAVDAGVRQVVLVAAGMDTRAWRLPLPDGCTVFEVDRPALLDLKAELLAGTAPAAHRVPVPADLTADWTASLDAAGHDPSRPTCWIVEGLLQYLPEPAVRTLLDAVSGRSAAGSRLLTDLVSARLLASEQMRPILDSMAAAGSPWIFGSDDPDALLAPYGWRGGVRLIDDVMAELGRGPSSADPSDAPGYLVHAIL